MRYFFLIYLLHYSNYTDIIIEWGSSERTVLGCCTRSLWTEVSPQPQVDAKGDLYRQWERCEKKLLTFLKKKSEKLLEHWGWGGGYQLSISGHWIIAVFHLVHPKSVLITEPPGLKIYVKSQKCNIDQNYVLFTALLLGLHASYPLCISLFW